MKYHLLRGIVCLIALFCLVANLPAQPTIRLGAGAFGGVEIPIVQEDQGSGSVFGFKGRVGIIPLIALEPYIAFTKFGTAEVEGIDFNLEGSKMTAFGLDATLGNQLGTIGIRPYLLAGLGFFTYSNDITSDIYDDGGTRFGGSFGVGLGLALSPRLGLDLRGKANIATAEGGGSKKSVAITGGINVNFSGLY
jgi:hypothetical protein